MMKDRNFDDLAERFRRNVYGGLKGRIRLEVLHRDLGEFFPQALQAVGEEPLRILDAGGGSGPFSLPMAAMGHHVTLCDLSEAMLEIARETISSQQLQQVTLIHGPVQALPVPARPFDLVLCHAVLEWVEDPQALLHQLAQQLQPGGLLSLTFYNRHGLVFKNLLRTNYKKILKEDYAGSRGSLTPTWPRDPCQVLQWVGEEGFRVLCHSGMRVFHDYILDNDKRDREPDTVVALELQFSRQLPYRDLGRYQHLVLEKPFC